MEYNKIEILLEKYFQGETSIAEEKELTNYFSSSDVAQHLEQYKPLFGYFSLAKGQKGTQEIPQFPTTRAKKRSFVWLSVAASVVVLLGIGTYVYINSTVTNEEQKLGSYDDPQVALRETQKALAMLSSNVNKGIGSVQLIQEYDNSKEKIFNQ
ncbi:hypothetical protein [Flavobacterium maritimum]|uniref:hypothetical protein n=1 Tax=Flavobacterium maritimum TaxID=3149042 RepID=UPI0032B36EB2